MIRRNVDAARDPLHIQSAAKILEQEHPSVWPALACVSLSTILVSLSVGFLSHELGIPREGLGYMLLLLSVGLVISVFLVIWHDGVTRIRKEARQDLKNAGIELV